MREPPSTGVDDWFFDRQMQRWLRHSGVERWRRILAERAANWDPQAWVRARQELGMPARPSRTVLPRRYADGMRRPDIELPDEAARFVEDHPDLIARLAGQSLPESPAEPTEAQLQRFRGYIRERLAAARTTEAEAARQAFRARYGIS